MIQSQMREYQQNHVIAKKGRHAGNLPLKPSKADLVESQRKAVEGKSIVGGYADISGDMNFVRRRLELAAA